MTEPKARPSSGRLAEWMGRVIATERAHLGLTVSQLARKAGVSTGLVSQLERGQGNPSLETVASLARALDVPIGSFFGGVSAEGAVVRRASRKRLVLTEGSLVYEMLVPDLAGRLSMLSIQLPSEFSNEDSPFQHVGEEVVLVMSGTLEVHLPGQHFRLHEGDSIRIDSAAPHWYATAGPVHVITAMTPPSF